MSALARVGVLEEMGTVELCQAVGVAWKVRWSPIEQDPDAGLMAAVDQFLTLGRSAETTGGGVVSKALIAPRAVEGMLHDGEQFDMGVAEIFDVRNELVGEFTIAEPAIAFFGDAAPGAEMDFVN